MTTDNPPAPEGPLGGSLRLSLLVGSVSVRSFAEVADSAAAGVRIGFDVQVIRKKQASGGWTVYFYRRSVES